MSLSSLSWPWMNYWFFNCKNKSAEQTLVTAERVLIWCESADREDLCVSNSFLKQIKCHLNIVKMTNKKKPIWFLVLQMRHCANFALPNKSQAALLGMFILCFYPGLIFALNCDNSLTVFMLKASCLCHERNFSSISIENSQSRNSGILLQTLWAPTWKCLCSSTTSTSPISPCP